MMYGILAEAAMVTHFGFLALLTVGGFFSWRWPKLLWGHVACVGWGVVSVTVGVGCPLTAVEKGTAQGEAPRV